MCLYPRLITNPKYKPNNKNGGKPPFPTDPRVTKVPISCGQCIECTKQKARQWQIRLTTHTQHKMNAYFITLTYSNESITQLRQNIPAKGYTLDNAIATKSMRLFLERWRKKHKYSLQHWFITELGHQGTENIHLHGIIWFKDKTDILKLDQYWQYGFTWKGTPIKHRGRITGYNNYVNERTIAYITKYVTKIDNKHKYYKPIILASPGIGNNYTNTEQAKMNKYNGTKTNETYRTSTGHQIQLPRYYRDKIYNDEQKEQLWLQKLDKQERWILGQKIDISNNQETYIKMLRQAQKKNKELGYRTNKINYEEKKYEEQIRELQQQTRTIKNKKPKQPPAGY